MSVSINDNTVNLEQTHDVYLSYAHSDKDYASTIADALTHHGFTVFDPERDVDVGMDWQETILDALKSSGFVLFLVPEAEGAGKRALQELGAAWALGTAIVPVIANSMRWKNCELPSKIANRMVIDASRMTVDDLVARIEAIESTRSS